MIRLPRHVRDAHVAGSSGSARIIRCRDGQRYYWAETLSGEIAVPDTRRVQNWIQNRDPVNWLANATGDGTVPLFGPTYVADGITWREVTLNPGTNGTSYIYTNVALPNKNPVWSSVWLRLPPGSGQKTLYLITASRSQYWPRSSRQDIDLNETPRRFVTWISGEEAYIGCHIQQDYVRGPITLWVGIDEQHCAMADICPIPYEGTSFDYAAEVVAPDVNYGFGAPGVAYFDYANPFTVDAHGVVTDTGVRTPLGRGGLIVAGADSNPLAPSYSSSAGGWTPEPGVVTWQGTGNPLPGLPAPDGFKGDGVDAFAHLAQDSTVQISAGQKVFLHAIVEVIGGAAGEDVELSLREGSTWVISQVLLRKGAGVIGNTIFSLYSPNSGPNGGDLYEFIAEDTEPDALSNRRLYCYSDHGVASQKTVYIHYVNVSIDAQPSLHVLLVNKSTSAAASRAADLAPLRWRPGTGWSPGRRLRCRLAVDTADLLLEGTLLGGEDQAGAAQVSLIRLVWDAAAAEYRIRISDGATTWTAPIPVPQSSGTEIRVDAGPGGARIAVGTTEATTAVPFDFSWVSETFLGSRGDGTDHVGLPLQVLPETW